MIWQSIAKKKWNENLKLLETSDCSKTSVNSCLVYNQCMEESVKRTVLKVSKNQVKTFCSLLFFFFKGVMIEIMAKRSLKDTFHKETSRDTW